MSHGQLVFRDVHKRFADVEVLRGLSAQVPLSGLTFLVGKSGSGKSVLCRLAVGLLHADGGEIDFDGEPVHALTPRKRRALRAKAPYLVQGPALLDWRTVEDNVALAAQTAPNAHFRAQEALARLGLSELGKRFPPSIGPGQAKRVALARALVLSPRYLLLDEPTTGLDAQAAAQVNEAILEIARSGLGALVVSHDYRALAAMADRVLVVAEGKAAFLGAREEFLSSWA
ncbi:MAG: ABC transporter ATP-binding protein [Myxococcota bacterium]